MDRVIVRFLNIDRDFKEENKTSEKLQLYMNQHLQLFKTLGEKKMSAIIFSELVQAFQNQKYIFSWKLCLVMSKKVVITMPFGA